MAPPETFGAECRRLREALNDGIPLTELDYRILRSNIVLLLADLERFGRPDRPVADALFLGQNLQASSGPEAR